MPDRSEAEEIGREFLKKLRKADNRKYRYMRHREVVIEGPYGDKYRFTGLRGNIPRWIRDEDYLSDFATMTPRQNDGHVTLP